MDTFGFVSASEKPEALYLRLRGVLIQFFLNGSGKLFVAAVPGALPDGIQHIKQFTPCSLVGHGIRVIITERQRVYNGIVCFLVHAYFTVERRGFYPHVVDPAKVRIAACISDAVSNRKIAEGRYLVSFKGGKKSGGSAEASVTDFIVIRCVLSD